MSRLSTIIPTFNSAKTLSRCLDSVISQSFTDWEVLMMDGVSNDKCFTIQKIPDLQWLIPISKMVD